MGLFKKKATDREEEERIPVHKASSSEDMPDIWHQEFKNSPREYAEMSRKQGEANLAAMQKMNTLGTGTLGAIKPVSTSTFAPTMSHVTPTPPPPFGMSYAVDSTGAYSTSTAHSSIDDLFGIRLYKLQGRLYIATGGRCYTFDNEQSLIATSYTEQFLFDNGAITLGTAGNLVQEFAQALQKKHGGGIHNDE